MIQVNKNRSHTIAVVVVLVFGMVLFYVGTDGFRAYTAEGARVNQLMKTQPEFPDVVFEDSNNRTYSFSEFEDKHVFITFFYTFCTTVCVELETNMAEVYAQIPESYIGEDIVFLSISFDPDNDDPTRLNQYKDFFNSDGETWRMARIPDQTELDFLLKQFGVLVIRDQYGDFAHNSAFYLVDRTGRLVDVMDYTKPQEAADAIIRILQAEKREG